MFRFSKKTDYALLALRYLADEAASDDVSARAIAERFEIPLELLAKILQQLARHGLIVAHKGVHGGYRLARSADAISVADVMRAVDGPTAIPPPLVLPPVASSSKPCASEERRPASTAVARPRNRRTAPEYLEAVRACLARRRHRVPSVP